MDHRLPFKNSSTNRTNGNGLNGRVSVASPPAFHGHLHHQATADESSLQSNSNSEDFSDEGVDPSRGLVSSAASQPSCQSKSYHHNDDTLTKNQHHRILLTPTANQTPSTAIRDQCYKTFLSQLIAMLIYP